MRYLTLQMIELLPQDRARHDGLGPERIRQARIHRDQCSLMLDSARSYAVRRSVLTARTSQTVVPASIIRSAARNWLREPLFAPRHYHSSSKAIIQLYETCREPVRAVSYVPRV
jgi:hypothetical protein